MATPDLTPKTVDELVRTWMDEIDMSREREKDWRKDGKEAEDLYEAKNEGDNFNILYSNTETLGPSLYGAMPKPVVQRRFRDPDELGKAVSQAGQRILEFLLDTNSEEYDDFDSAMKDAVLDGLLPGRGVTEFIYHAETSTVEGVEQLEYECVYPKSTTWNRFYHGYAKRWCDVQWCAVELYLDKPSVKKEFGAAIADKMQFTIEGDADQDRKGEGRDEQEKKTKTKTACIYKIWDKRKREILWVSPNHPTSILRTDEDELKLTGFYPFPKPLRFMRKSNNLTPTTLYNLYKTQAKELNSISNRLIGLIKQCKIRGVYDSTIGELEEVLKQEEGELVAAENAASLQSTKGLESAIWLMPIENIITVIKELYIARAQCKQTIYEITGISDIIRGQTVASETLGAQKIKEQWVTLRLKNMQKEVQRFVRESLRIMLEIASKRFQPDTWAKMTGLPYSTPEQLQQAQQIAQAYQQRALETGQPPQVDPLVQHTLQAPQWSQVIEVLKDDMQRQYKIDIETNSTLDVDASEDKQQLGDLMNAISQFLNGIGPLVESGMLPFQAAQAFLLVVIRKFRFGPEIEDYIKQMQAPKPQDDGKKAEAMMKDQQEKARLAHDQRVEDNAAKQKEVDSQRQHQASQDGDKAKILMEQQKIAAEAEADTRRIAAERAAQLAELSAKRETAKMEALIQQETDIKKAELDRQTAIDVAKIQAAAQAESDARKAATEKDKSDKQAATQVHATEAQASTENKKTESESKAHEMMATLIEKVLEGQQQMMELFSAEKVVNRGQDGKVASIGLKRVK